MMPTSISQIIEQIFNAAFSIGAAWFFIQQFATNDTEHAKFGAAGGTLGTGAGVLAGLCFMLIVYGVNRKTILRKVAKGHAPPRRILPRNFSGSFSDGNTGHLHDLYL